MQFINSYHSVLRFSQFSSVSMSASDKPVKNAQGRYDNVDFRKAAGYKYPPIKCSYNRRDVLLFVSERHLFTMVDP